MQTEDLIPIFKGKVFVFDSSITRNAEAVEELEKKITSRKGAVHKNRITEATHCVLFCGDAPCSESLKKRCLAKKIRMVNSSWVDSAIERENCEIPSTLVFNLGEQQPTRRQSNLQSSTERSRVAEEEEDEEEAGMCEGDTALY